ncbi:MAG: DUF885 domain-containing protein [Gammaproteobacteria bacterium]
MNSEHAEQFDRLVESYYQAWFRYHPEAAVDAGVAGFESRLRPYHDDDIGALTALNEKLLSGLDEIDPERLDDDRALDLQVLRGAALIEHHELLEFDWRRRDPAAFLPFHAIYQLTVRPVADLRTALKSRLRAIPTYLRGARAQLTTLPELIPAHWLESAVVEAEAGAGFLQRLHSHPKLVQGGALGELRRLQEAAVRAVLDYARFLESELAARAAGDFAVGRSHFERLLHHRHFLPVDADALYGFGERLFAETHRQLEAVTRTLRGDGNVAAMTEALRAEHPAADQLIETYRERMRAARDYLAHHDIVTLPEGERLSVVETPEFLRHQIPFAAYLDPAPNDPQQQGYYYVTPATSEELLGEHHSAGIANTCVHEAWPGHHLQFVVANKNPVSRTLPRLLNPSATLYEGWALYCEQMMQEEGFLDRPEHRFILLRDRLWRALRVMIDVEIQTRGAGLDRAADRLVEALGFPREQAMADLNWYSHAPTVPSGYATGWALITALRRYLQARDPEFELRPFHDRLLGAGSVGLPLVIQRQFGRSAWEAVRGVVGGENSA